MSMRENIEWQNSSEILIRTKISVSKNYRVEYRVLISMSSSSPKDEMKIFMFNYNSWSRIFSSYLWDKLSAQTLTIY